MASTSAFWTRTQKSWSDILDISVLNRDWSSNPRKVLRTVSM